MHSSSLSPAVKSTTTSVAPTLPSKVVSALLSAVHSGSACFADVIAFINQHYDFCPTAFANGNQNNLIGQNEGSARVFYFAKIHHLSAADTLALFAEHYQSVLATPNGSDHQNIRQFWYYAWTGVIFTAPALVLKQ